MSREQFLQGIEQFNYREFYGCHNTLEALWIDAVEPDRKFYQSILQIAVGCYHFKSYNWRGAAILLGEGIRLLSSYQPDYQGIDVFSLVRESQKLLHYLQQTNFEQITVIAKQFENISENDTQRLPYILTVNH
jgi:predicted metal-dependent hydrolase